MVSICRRELKMPFDGVVVKSVVEELSALITGGRIEKIFQPESDEIVLNMRAKSQSLRLVLSANASCPRIHITDTQKENPANPPVFCMLLRKHLSGGKVIAVEFHDFERVISLLIESLNELGDLSIKKLVIEIMGRHSNIILLNSEGKIIDAIKHVDNYISSVREIMPARLYTAPPSQDKTSPFSLNVDDFFTKAINDPVLKNIGIGKILLNNIKGFSPLLCKEICWRSEIDGKTPLAEIKRDVLDHLKNVLKDIIECIAKSDYSPCIVFEDKAQQRPVDFHCLKLSQYVNARYIPSINQVLNTFYLARDNAERLKQKRSSLFSVLHNNIQRCNKKLALQQEKLREVSDREKLKLYGELITANIHSIPLNAGSVSLLNYYSENNEYVEIPLDENLLPQENAQKYFKKYAKAKRAFKYTRIQLQETIKELEYLESVEHLLESCTTLQEIEEIREELVEQGYINRKKKSSQKKWVKPSKPLRFISSDGFDIFVGRNNNQNDNLTMKMASSNDIWLHTRNIPGSHVIIKTCNKNVSDIALEEAAVIAAFHSKAVMSSNVPVDYTTANNVKKPPGSKPGMVIYENFKTITVTPDAAQVDKLKVQET
jgi:predicted ribosome quality control (RQC) complex YloA/Tae2 family protein